MPREVQPCGTRAAYARHRVRGEVACRACKAAMAEYQRKRTAKELSPRVLKPCGTSAAYERHRKNGEEPCEPCVEANRVATRERSRVRLARRVAEREAEAARLRALEAAPEPIVVTRVVQGPEGVGPCAVAANGFLWDPIRDDETPSRARGRHVVAQRICRTACLVFAWCHESAPRVAGVVAGVVS